LVEGALEGLWELSDAEYHIRILTHRLNHGHDYRTAVESTVKWLDENVIPYRSLAVVGEGDHKSNYRAEILLDDGPHNITDWLNRTWDTAIVFDRPWNQEIEIPPKVIRSNGDIPTLHRAVGWKEAVETIREEVGL
jgi:5'(3')-deoxyribonucleotidase